MLTYRDLKIIQEGNRRHADVMTLLRDIKRLRELVTKLYVHTGQIVYRETGNDTYQGMRALRDAMAKEPCVTEFLRVQEKHLELEYRRRAAEQEQAQKKR